MINVKIQSPLCAPSQSCRPFFFETVAQVNESAVDTYGGVPLSSALHKVDPGESARIISVHRAVSSINLFVRLPQIPYSIIEAVPVPVIDTLSGMPILLNKPHQPVSVVPPPVYEHATIRLPAVADVISRFLASACLLVGRVLFPVEFSTSTVVSESFKNSSSRHHDARATNKTVPFQGGALLLAK